MGEFELNVKPEVARPLLEKAWPQKFRTHKATLRYKLKNGVVPTGIDPVILKKFVENEEEPKKQQQRKQNAENRGKLTITHCLGRRSYAQKSFKKNEDQPLKTFSRVEKWFFGHERMDGSVLECAKEKYAELKAIESKRKALSISGENNSQTYVDLDSDELVEAFGKEKKGGVCGWSSHVSKKQLIQLGVAMAKLNENNNVKEVNSNHDLLSLRMNNMEDTLKVLVNIASKLKDNDVTVMPTTTTTTPTSDRYSNTGNGQTQCNLVQNLDNIFTAMGASQPIHPMSSPVEKNTCAIV